MPLSLPGIKTFLFFVMINRRHIIFFLSILFGSSLMAQDTLPRITVQNINNNIIVSWKNNYGANISTINIQRSYDSIKNFITIGSVLEPMNRENGFVDNKAYRPNMFYRVFIAFEGGRYIFSKSYRPVKDSLLATGNEVDKNKPEEGPYVMAIPDAPGTVNRGKSGAKLSPVPPPLPLPPPPPPRFVFVPSKFIYTAKDNNLIVDLGEITGKRYSIKFYDESDNVIFEIKKLSEPYLIIEKVNFKHAGWFYFKLFDNGILKEKNQFYIPKEGKTGIPPNELGKQFK
jgi:hypothetical protein